MRKFRENLLDALIGGTLFITPNQFGAFLMSLRPLMYFPVLLL
jgi:hypothetical protein